MKTESCRTCKSNFEITDQDLGFYAKINVPTPALCPDCRFQKRLAVCNERTLYRRACGLCKKSSISMFQEGTSFPVYCLPCWRGDAWDELSYGREYDFSRPFFDQFAELKNIVPRYAILQQGTMENSEYCNRASNDKDCYLCFRTNYSEGCMYSHLTNNSVECTDCLNAQKCERLYDSINCARCYNSRSLQECSDCIDSSFLYNCRNLQNCFGCVNLRNKEYHIWNEPYSKEDYFKKIKEMGLEKRGAIEEYSKKFEEFKKQFPYEAVFQTQAVNSTGNWLVNTKNTENSFSSRDTEDSKNLFGVVGARDSMDYTYFGMDSELVYESSNCGYNAYNVQFSNELVPACSNGFYSDACFSSSNIFGCVGARKREYCILNKQYTKEEYESLILQIKEHMKSTGEWGEFFPPEINHFAYNETVAQEYFPLTKEEALAKGFLWKEPEAKNYPITKEPKDLPQSIAEVSDSILQDVIGCEHNGNCMEQCTFAFKLIPAELGFYRKQNIPIPKLCPNCRHYTRLKKTPPPKLWKRSCMCSLKNHNTHQEACPNEFQTSYAPDSEKLVYCKECFNAEVQ